MTALARVTIALAGYRLVTGAAAAQQTIARDPSSPTIHATAIRTVVTLKGQPAVIQMWKGWCQKFLGLQNFPGGVGGEVGVYRRLPGRARPTSLPGIPQALATLMLGVLSVVPDDQIWWPAPELADSIDFSLINRITYFALPMRQPGIEVRPLRQANGYSSFNEVFMSDARVPADHVVGEINNGWGIAT